MSAALDFLKRFLGKKPLPVTKAGTPLSSVASTAPQTSTVKSGRNPIKDKLYGNLPMDQWPPAGGDVSTFPWSEFDAARNHLATGHTEQAIACWRTLVATPALEILHYLQAWHFLRQNGVQPSEEEAKNVFGVIGEQGRSGILIAVYLDGRARLYGDQGQGIVWEHPDASLDPLIETVLGAATALVRKMKQSDPQIDSSRFSVNSISVLTPSGIYTKTGAPGSFEVTPLIKPIADGFASIIMALMEKANVEPKGKR